MKVVDIADELFREVGEPSTYSIASIAYWVRANVGRLNSHINTFFVVNSSFEISQETDTKNDNTLVESEINLDEAAVLKKMFLIHYYDREIRSNISNAGSKLTKTKLLNLWPI